MILGAIMEARFVFMQEVFSAELPQRNTPFLTRQMMIHAKVRATVCCMMYCQYLRILWKAKQKAGKLGKLRKYDALMERLRRMSSRTTGTRTLTYLNNLKHDHYTGAFFRGFGKPHHANTDWLTRTWNEETALRALQRRTSM